MHLLLSSCSKVVKNLSVTALPSLERSVFSKQKTSLFKKTELNFSNEFSSLNEKASKTSSAFKLFPQTKVLPKRTHQFKITEFKFNQRRPHSLFKKKNQNNNNIFCNSSSEQNQLSTKTSNSIQWATSRCFSSSQTSSQTIAQSPSALSALVGLGGFVLSFFGLWAKDELSSFAAGHEKKSKELTMDITTSVKNHPVLQMLEDEHIDRLVHCMYSQRFDPGAMLITEGMRESQVFYIESGECEVLNENGDVLQILKPGKTFGERGFMFGTKRSASVRTLTDTVVWVIDRDDLLNDVLYSSQRLRNVWQSLCVKEGKEEYMDKATFIKYLVGGSYGPEIASRMSFLFEIANRGGGGRLEFAEFALFDLMSKKEDAEFELAFRLFDNRHQGYVTKEDVQRVLGEKNLMGAQGFSFDYSCNLIKRFFGTDGQTKLKPREFSQFFLNLTEEIPRQLFRFYDSEGKGYLNQEEFVNLIPHFGTWRLPLPLQQKLFEIKSLHGDSQVITYPEFIAFNDFLNRLPALEAFIENACVDEGVSAITKRQFKSQARNHISSNMSPLEVDIIFTIFDANHSGTISPDDIARLLGKESKSFDIGQFFNFSNPQQFIIDSLSHFGLGAIAGGTGAAAVYPIDLVKTRMQNQRNQGDPAKKLYRNSFHCFTQTIRNEGPSGLYRGLGPQLVGVAPEKAIKLTVNDLLRSAFRDERKGKIYFPLEVLAGSFAGASQVVFTNPLEIVKIRLQVQGETAKLVDEFKPKGAIAIVRELGLTGLYKGAGACLLRDVPFSGIYFPLYASVKETFASQREDKRPANIDLLLAGALAGAPAASLTTPADVIKTRLQVEARKGESTYSGIRDCAVKVFQEEGFTAFWKGAPARVFRSSPQFGVTLLTYELLHRVFTPDINPKPPTNVAIEVRDFTSANSETSGIRKLTENFNILRK